MTITTLPNTGLGSGPLVSIIGSEVIPFDNNGGANPAIAIVSGGPGGWVRLPTPTRLLWKTGPSADEIAACAIKIVNGSGYALDIQNPSGAIVAVLSAMITATSPFCEFYWRPDASLWVPFCWLGRTS